MSIDRDKLMARVEGIAARAAERDDFYCRVNQRAETASNRYLWRHRFYAQALLTNAMFALLGAGISGPTVAQWRAPSQKQALIARQIIRDCYAKRGPTTVNIIWKALKPAASKGSVKKCFSAGVDLKLLKRVTGGYVPTALLVQEQQERLTEKLMDPDVQAFCRFAVMWADQRHMAFDAMGTGGDVNFDGEREQTLFEDIVAGVFDLDE